MTNKKFLKIIFSLLVTFFVYGLNSGCVSGAEAKRAVDFRLKSLEGNEVALKDSSGRPVLLFFWTSWCYHCVRAIPELRQLRDEFNEEELEILAINLKESRSRIKSFIQRHETNYKVLLDKKGRVSNLYNVYGIPAVILVDREGFIRYRGSRFPRRLDRLLEEN